MHSQTPYSKSVLLLQPSLAAAIERVLHCQEHSLQDYIETSVMLLFAGCHLINHVRIIIGAQGIITRSKQ